MSISKNIYSNSPHFLKNIIADLYAIKMSSYRYTGLSYVEDIYKFDSLLNYKKNRLVSHLKSAKNCVFWNDYFVKNKITTNDIHNEPFSIYDDLPIISKKDVIGNESEFLNNSFKINTLIKASTSGSTGGALKFYETKSSELERWGVWWRYRNQLGITKNLSQAYFGGKSIIPIEQTKPPFWVGGLVSNQINFSVYHISNGTISHYISKLNSYKPKWIHGYPSALYALSKIAIENGLKVNFKVDFITIGSESLLDHQKNIIECFFNCPVRQHYGLSESVANISENINGDLVVDEEFSLVDFKKLNNDGLYKIIGTNWNNPAFPLLKYDTGDVAYSHNDLTNYLSSNRIVQRIDGRIEDFLLLPDGRMIGRVAEVAKSVDGVIESQIYQYKDYSIEVRVVKNDKFNNSSEEFLEKKLKDKIGNSIDIKIKITDKIDKTSNGKHRFLISEVKNETNSSRHG